MKNLELRERSTILLLSAVAGISIANVYYSQPLLNKLRSSFSQDGFWVGLVAASTQIGFATGMILISPLGDRMDRRRLICWQAVGICIALGFAATAPTLNVLIVSSFFIGMFATMAQQAGPFAMEITPQSRQGHAVGTVMCGLLLGILLARTFSGVIAEYFNWRAVFIASIAMMALLAVIVVLRLPSSRPSTNLSYRRLIGSPWILALELRELREAAITGGLLFAAFSMFWTVLALLLAEPPFRLGAEIAGLFGVIGAVGALVAPWAGKLADQQGPRTVISYSIVLVAISYLIFWLSRSSLIGLVVGVVVLDVGIQGAQVANQTRIFSLRPDARSRINTVYMTCYFICGAIGSTTGAYVWHNYGWTGISIAGLTFCFISYANHQVNTRC